MITNKLKIEGFKMIGDPITVHFPEGKKFIGILGEEATGKSTLLESIQFALFGLGYQEHKTDELITWGKEKARVTIDFTIENQQYRIQRSVRKAGSQSARLMRIIDGAADYENIVEGVQEVSQKIQSLLGLEADMYSKFFYIQQQDLEAFTELSDANKRQFLSKAFGIETFDQAIEKLAKDRDMLRTELQDMEAEFERVSENKAIYEKRLEEKEDLEFTLSRTRPELISLKREVEETRSETQNRSWRSIFDPLNQLLTSEIEKAAEISRQQDELFRKQQQFSHCEQILNKCRGEVEQLKGSLESTSSKSVPNEEEEKFRPLNAIGNNKTQQELFSAAEQSPSKEDIVRAKKKYLAIFLAFFATGIALIIASFFTSAVTIPSGLAALITAIFFIRRYDAVEKSSLLNPSSPTKSVHNEEIERFRPLHALGNNIQQKSFSASTVQSLPKEEIIKAKTKYLAIFLGLLATGIALIVTSFFTSAVIFVLGMAALITSIFVSRKYDVIDNPSLPNPSGHGSSSGSKPAKILVQQPVGNLTELSKHSSFDYAENIRSRLSEIFREIKLETGQESIEQLESLIASLKREITELNSQELQSKQEEVTRRISNLQNKISKLEQERDHQDNNDKVTVYDIDDERYLILKTNFEKVHEAVSNSEAVLRRVQQELKLLKPDYDLFPKLEKKISELREAIFLLDATEKMLSETNAELMNKGITASVLLMNRLLPQLTFQQYSNVEITNSLDFNVYSSASGRYEPWQSFSDRIQDQFVLTLRLVLAHFALNALSRRDSSPCPLLLDECILGSDERKVGCFQLLRAMEGTFSQIVVATDDRKLSCCVDYVIKLIRSNDGFTMLRSTGTGPKAFERDAHA
jgi:DNA repair exonuclease SbcCD ATPase subunit